MILTGFLLAFMLSCCRAETESSDEVPFVVASQGGSSEPKISNLLPEIEVPTLTGAESSISRGRSDIEIEEDQPPRGYFYPKPAKPFNLPEFKTLDADEPLVGSAHFSQDDSAEGERLPRSPRARPPIYRPPNFRPPNFRPPNFRPPNFRPPGYDPPPPFVPGFIPPNDIRPLPALYGRPGRY